MTRLEKLLDDNYLRIEKSSNCVQYIFVHLKREEYLKKGFFTMGRLRPSEDDELRYSTVTGELDLHDYVASKALEVFIEYYNRAVSNESVRQIKVIHGYGSSGKGGTINTMIRTFLNTYPDAVSFKLGENPGYTIVIPNLLLPQLSEYISSKVYEFCKNPKTKEKIINKFIIYGALEVKRAISILVRQKKIRIEWKGKYKLFRANV